MVSSTKIVNIAIPAIAKNAAKIIVIIVSMLYLI